MAELREHAGRRWAVQLLYAVPDSAWCLELSEAVPAPASWADIPDAVSHLPGRAFAAALVRDEDPSADPTIHLLGREEHPVPYEIFRGFMEKVAEEINRCGAVSPATDGVVD